MDKTRLMTPLERKFVNDPKNFDSSKDHRQYVDLMKAGDKFHADGNQLYEAASHRAVQERIYKSGFNKNNSGSHHDYAWNCLHMHSIGTVRGIANHGMSFDDAFYYDKDRHHYYLTPEGLAFCKNNKIGYYGVDSGIVSVEKPNNIDYPSQYETKPAYVGGQPVKYGTYSESTGYTSYVSNKPVRNWMQSAIPTNSDEVELFVG